MTSPARLGSLWHTERPRRALGLAIGPVAFVGAWSIGGALTPGYSPVYDAISRIAEVGAPRAALMTAGFVTYGTAVLIGSTALRGTAFDRLWLVAAANGVATLGVAATPLEHSELVDALHAVTATVGYVTIGALPALAVPVLRHHGRRGLGSASAAVAALVAASLITTPFTDANGFFQRLGLTLGDAWLAALGLSLWAGSRRAVGAPADPA